MSRKHTLAIGCLLLAALAAAYAFRQERTGSGSRRRQRA